MAPDFDTTTPALVLKLDHNVMHHGGLGVIRSLGRAGIPVYAVYEHPLAPAAHSRYLHGRFRWNPAPSPEPEQFLEGLIRLAERIGQPTVLIPTDDAGAILLAEYGDTLRQWFRFPVIAPDLPRRLAGKYTLTRLCESLGLPSVRATMTRRFRDGEWFAERTGFPVLVKLAHPWEATVGALPSTTLVRSHGHLVEVFRQAGGAALMLQEYIPGGPGQDWFFHGYCDGTSHATLAFTGVKERSYPPHAGLTSLGRCVPNERLRREVTGLLRRINYRGIMDLDLRYDQRDDRYKLLDFNPRIGAQFRLFTTADELDVARAAHLDLTGRPVPPSEPIPERGFLVENYDSLAALGYLRRGELGIRSWIASLRRVNEAAWFARDDLAPFGLMCLRTAVRAVSRPLRRRGVAPRRGAVQPVFRPGRATRSGGPATASGNGSSSDPTERTGS